MPPPELQASSFSAYPPLARQTALANLDLLRQLPPVFVPFLLKETRTLDWKFPAEREELLDQLKYLQRLPPPDRARAMSAFAALRLSPALETFDAVDQPAQFLERLSAHLWATAQMDAFRGASERYLREFRAACPEPQPASPRLAIVMIGQGLPNDGGYRLFRKLRREGTLFSAVETQGGLEQIVRVLGARARVSRSSGNSNSGGDAKGNTGSDAKGNTGGDAKGNTGGDAKGNTGSDTKGNSGGDAKGNTGSDTKGNTGSDAKGNTGSDAKGNTGSDAKGNNGYAHWLIDGGETDLAAADAPGVTSVSYARLAPLRTALNARIKRALDAGMSPEALRTELAATTPQTLGVNVSPGDECMDRFQVGLFTEGSGTQVYSTTFVQWAAREALRRARPLTLVARYAPRLREASMAELLNARATAALDPGGSLVDADMGAWYTWISLQRLTGADRSRFVVWFEGHNQAVAVGPRFARAAEDHTPVRLDELLQRE